ncbi:MAG: inositol monophosphatase [Chloroflexi bacterium]|nr:inositol monophosphatase [Chloroflexota bacterium]
MNSRLQTAARAARAAGKILRAKFDATREITSKGKRDIVTDADFAADRAIRDILLGRFPQDRILSEEGDAAAWQALWAETETNDDLAVWIVDPLDGTTNYARHHSIFCVSIALYQKRSVQAGVIYDCIHNELFVAERGRGATLNGKPIVATTTRILDDAVVGLEWGRAQSARRRTSELLAKLATRVMTVRSSGSAALSLCYVAAGRLDGYFHLSLAPWDVAAGALIAEEAGGCVTDPSGAPWTVHSKAYVATNGPLHPTVLKFFKRRRL